MSTYSEINIEHWPRKKQYLFFKDFEDPFFNITANIEIGQLPDYAREKGFSFNLCSLFFSQKVINQIPEFKYRIKDGLAVFYDTIHCGSTILLPDKTFTFCYFNQTPDLATYDRQGKQNIIDLIRNPEFNPRDEQLNMIHYSTLPWIKFTAIKNPRQFSVPDSTPKIIFGKWFEENGKNFIPVSVEAHHGLMDGYHVGMYFNKLEKELQAI